MELGGWELPQYSYLSPAKLELGNDVIVSLYHSPPWTRVFLDNRQLGQKCPWEIVPWTLSPFPWTIVARSSRVTLTARELTKMSALDSCFPDYGHLVDA